MKSQQAQPIAQQNPQSASVISGGITAQEKKDFLDSIELLKSENLNLQGKAGGSGIAPMPQQQVFRSLMLALGRAKQIIATLDERGKSAQQQQADLQQHQQDQ